MIYKYVLFSLFAVRAIAGILFYSPIIQHMHKPIRQGIIFTKHILFLQHLLWSKYSVKEMFPALFVLNIIDRMTPIKFHQP